MKEMKSIMTLVHERLGKEQLGFFETGEASDPLRDRLFEDLYDILSRYRENNNGHFKLGSLIPLASALGRIIQQGIIPEELVWRLIRSLVSILDIRVLSNRMDTLREAVDESLQRPVSKRVREEIKSILGGIWVDLPRAQTLTSAERDTLANELVKVFQNMENIAIPNKEAVLPRLRVQVWADIEQALLEMNWDTRDILALKILVNRKLSNRKPN